MPMLPIPSQFLSRFRLPLPLSLPHPSRSQSFRPGPQFVALARSLPSTELVSAVSSNPTSPLSLSSFPIRRPFSLSKPANSGSLQSSPPIVRGPATLTVTLPPNSTPNLIGSIFPTANGIFASHRSDASTDDDLTDSRAAAMSDDTPLPPALANLIYQAAPPPSLGRPLGDKRTSFRNDGSSLGAGNSSPLVSMPLAPPMNLATGGPSVNANLYQSDPPYSRASLKLAGSPISGLQNPNSSSLPAGPLILAPTPGTSSPLYAPYSTAPRILSTVPSSSAPTLNAQGSQVGPGSVVVASSSSSSSSSLGGGVGGGGINDGSQDLDQNGLLLTRLDPNASTSSMSELGGIGNNSGNGLKSKRRSRQLESPITQVQPPQQQSSIQQQSQQQLQQQQQQQLQQQSSYVGQSMHANALNYPYQPPPQHQLQHQPLQQQQQQQQPLYNSQGAQSSSSSSSSPRRDLKTNTSRRASSSGGSSSSGGGFFHRFFGALRQCVCLSSSSAGSASSGSRGPDSISSGTLRDSDSSMMALGGGQSELQSPSSAEFSMLQVMQPSYLLPPRSKADDGKKCLVLDLDETLVHSSFKPVPNADFIVPVEIEGQRHQVYVLKRPGVDEFLRAVAKRWEIVIFTASLNKYANPVIDLLDRGRVVQHRLFRESCHQYTGNYVKDLTHLGRDLRHTIIIDNSPSSYMFQPKNAVPCTSWFDDVNDLELLELLPVLDDLASADDIYTITNDVNFVKRRRHRLDRMDLHSGMGGGGGGGGIGGIPVYHRTL